MQLVPFVVLFAPALSHPGITTVLESSLFVHLHICAFPDVCLFLFSLSLLKKTKTNADRNKERKQAV